LTLSKAERFAAISRAHNKGLKILTLCEFAKVSLAGFYKWKKNKGCKELRDADSVKLVRDIADKFNNKVGIRRISMKLRAMGVVMNTKKILRIKNEYNIVTKIRKRRPGVISLIKNKEHRIAPNLLGQNFNIGCPDKVYCTDITYLFYRGGIGYLSATKDISTREIVAHHISCGLGMDAGSESIADMLSKRNLKGVIIHSDQGVHYTHPEYIKMLTKYGVIQSMSRKGVCLDNAPIESFFGHMKDEAEYSNCASLAELRQEIDKYIRFYNNERSQWDLKKMPPARYREHLLSLTPN